MNLFQPFILRPQATNYVEILHVSDFNTKNDPSLTNVLQNIIPVDLTYFTLGKDRIWDSCGIKQSGRKIN